MIEWKIFPSGKSFNAPLYAGGGPGNLAPTFPSPAPVAPWQCTQYLPNNTSPSFSAASEYTIGFFKYNPADVYPSGVFGYTYGIKPLAIVPATGNLELFKVSPLIM